MSMDDLDAEMAEWGAIAKAKRERPASRSQVKEIMRLLDERGGNPLAEGGWLAGPTTRAEVEDMSRDEADDYIRSMRGEY